MAYLVSLTILPLFPQRKVLKFFKNKQSEKETRNCYDLVTFHPHVYAHWSVNSIIVVCKQRFS